MDSKLLLYLFIHGFSSTLFSVQNNIVFLQQTVFKVFFMYQNVIQTFQTYWVDSSNQSNLSIQNSCSTDYPLFFHFVNIEYLFDPFPKLHNCVLTLFPQVVLAEDHCFFFVTTFMTVVMVATRTSVVMSFGLMSVRKYYRSCRWRPMMMSAVVSAPRMPPYPWVGCHYSWLRSIMIYFNVWVYPWLSGLCSSSNFLRSRDPLFLFLYG